MRTLAQLIAVAALLALGQTASATMLVASDNAFFKGGSTNGNESQQLDLRDAFSYHNDDYAFLRFAINAAGDTIAGAAVGDVTAVQLNLTVTSAFAGSDKIAVFALDDLADADDIDLDGDPGTDTYLSETTWNAGNLTPQNNPAGDRQAPNSLTSSQIGLLTGFGTVSGALDVSVTLDLTAFQTLITDSSNDEITLILLGGKDRDVRVASLSNTNGHGKPTLKLTVVPEPASLALLGLGGLVMLRRRR